VSTRRLALLSLLPAAALTACAGARPPAPAPCAAAGLPCGAAPAAAAPAGPTGPPQLAYDPHVIEVSRADLELVGKNDEELFAIGQAAFSAGELERAANAFGRLADLHPSSRREATALFNAGLAWHKLEKWRLALERYGTLTRKYEGPDADEAAFKAAECRYHLDELPEARALLDKLARRTDLSPSDHVRALTQRGIVELEAGLTTEAEQSLRLAVSAWKAADAQERLDDYFPSQAQFYLGEVYRTHFLAVKLDPSSGGREGEARLARDLEDKAGLLLSAQGHYLRAIRMGNADWAVAAGFRIGELYDAFHAALVEAPLPPGLDEEETAAYRSELKRKVRVLVTKAIAIYEQTLAVAGRTRIANNRFVAETQASLDRMKRALLEVPPDPAPEAEPKLPPDAVPDKG
jgi:tetratricopeptide (TPR) repeat protein